MKPAVLSNHHAEAKALLDQLLAAGVSPEDQQTITDALEGQTGSLEALSVTLQWMAEREAHSAGLTVIITDFQNRKARFDRQIKQARQAILSFIEAAGIKDALERPEGTISVRKGTPQVIRAADFDVARLPAGLTRTKVEPDMTAIKKALERGDDVPGAFLSNSAPTISIRTA